MLGFLITVHAIISLLLITVVLMQASQGGGLAGSIGGQTTNAIFGGRGAATALSKITTYLAVAFMGLALLISLVGSPGTGGTNSVIEQAQEERTLAPNTDGLALPTPPIQDSEKIITDMGRSGGIGRHAGLRGLWGKPRAGSSPAFGTRKLK